MNQSIAGYLWPQVSEDQFTWWAQQILHLYLVWVSIPWLSPYACAACAARESSVRQREVMGAMIQYDTSTIWSWIWIYLMHSDTNIPIPWALSILDFSFLAVLAFVHRRASAHRSLPESMQTIMESDWSHTLKRLDFKSLPCLIFLWYFIFPGYTFHFPLFSMSRSRNLVSSWRLLTLIQTCEPSIQ